LNWVKEAKPDLAIVDLGLPDMDGREVCKTIKKNPATRALPVIILTAQTSNEVKIDSQLLCQANLFLNKPIDVDDLAKAVNTILEKVEREKLLFRSSINSRTFPHGRST